MKRPAPTRAATASSFAPPKTSSTESSIEVKLEVIANPSSFAASGISSTCEPGRPECCRNRAPLSSQVRMRWLTSLSTWSASWVAAIDSGLFPDRANDTRRVGTSSGKLSRGSATMSVVATASTCRPSMRDSVGAAIEPTKAEVPAPVSTIRRPGRSSSRSRKASSSTRRPSTIRDTAVQTSGCWSISRTVAVAPGSTSWSAGSRDT